MILTIKTPSLSLLKAGIWEADLMMGLETEVFSDNTFEIVCHDPAKVDRILEISQGKVIHQQ
jgi:hypothetical protein